MERTKNRELVIGVVSNRYALIFATILGLLGIGVLLFYTNLLTSFIALLGFFFYVVMYSIFKRRSEYGTLVGSISGAVPPVVGYVALSNQFDTGALLLFLILTVWQMPHFYAIAIFRMKDYASAKIPVLPVVRGISTTKIHILLYVCAFIIVSSLFTILKLTGYIYLIIVLLLSFTWLFLGIKGFKTTDDVRWARKMFGFSLLNLLVFCIMISIDSFLH